MSKKISRHYRIREDILQELSGMLVLLNRDRNENDREITETYIVEAAIVMFVNRWKKGIDQAEREKRFVDRV